MCAPLLLNRSLELHNLSVFSMLFNCQLEEQEDDDSM
jgi:hypothetical protein